MKTNLTMLLYYAEEIQDLVLIQKIRDLEVELCEYTKYPHYRCKDVKELIQKILGEIS